MKMGRIWLRVSIFVLLFLASDIARGDGLQLGQTKEQLKLEYEVVVRDLGNERVAITLTIISEGRLAPLEALDLVVPSNDGSSSSDLALSLASRKVDGKLIIDAQLKRDLADRAEIHLKTSNVDGKSEGLTFYYHVVPVAKFRKIRNSTL